AHFGHLLGGRYADFDRLGGESIAVDAPAIVHDADVDRVAGLAGGHRQPAGLAFTRREAVRRRFDPMINRVAEKVHQWITDQFDHLAIEFDFTILELDENLLAQFGGKVAY